MAAKATTENILIPSIDIRTATIQLVGDTPLIMHKWSEKAKKEILDKQMKVAKSKGKDAKNPVEDFIESMYWLSGKPEAYTEEAFAEAIRNGARFGFPAVAFKAAAVDAGYRAGITKNLVSARGSFHIPNEYVTIRARNVGTVAGSVNGCGELDGEFVSPVPSIREDMVRIGMGVADIRYRGMFENWCCVIPVRYNAGVISLEQVINLFNLGGFACGVGEWRVERGGSFGAFHVS